MSHNDYHSRSMNCYTQYYYKASRDAAPETPPTLKRKAQNSPPSSAKQIDISPNSLRTPIKKQKGDKEAHDKATVLENMGKKDKIERFLYQGRLDGPDYVPAKMTPAIRESDEIRELRTRFVMANPIHREEELRLCPLLERAAVLDIIDESLNKLASPQPSTALCKEVYPELLRKIKIILDVDQAQPDNSAFLESGGHLHSLQPQYAQPRIQTGRRGDAYGIHAQWRLNEWRAEGWPYVVPVEAVKKEQRLGMEMFGDDVDSQFRLRDLHMKNERIKDGRDRVDGLGYSDAER